MKLLLPLSFMVLFTIFGASGDNFQYYQGPRDKSNATFVKWWTEFQTWIEEASTGIDLSIYDNENLAWARTSFVQPQIMLHDRFLFDRESNQWTVEKYLNDLNDRYVHTHK